MTVDNNNNVCFFLLLGNLRFDTEKTLKLHTDMKHTPSTYVYTCPSCPKTFMQPGAVIRHLCNDHK